MNHDHPTATFSVIYHVSQSLEYKPNTSIDIMTQKSTHHANKYLEKECVILGGGCSGLGLAYALSQQQQPIDCLVLESRTNYTHDKTWCFWEKNATPWTELATCHWSQWSYQEKNQAPIIHTSTQWRYYYLPSIIYYEKIQQVLKNHSHIKLMLGQEITSVHGETKHKIPNNDYPWLIKTQSGLTVKARRVIDTRPNHHTKSILYQCFFGIEINIKHLSTKTVALMHDMCSDHHGFRFNYILPISPERILFEHTRFCSYPIDSPLLKRECIQAFKHKFPKIQLKYAPRHQTIEQDSLSTSGTVHREEYGCLPMGLIQNDTPSASDMGGISAGALRAASGYGFRRIQKWASQTARQIIQEHQKMLNSQPRRITHQYDPLWQKKMDALFLTTLKNNAEKGPRFFSQLANKLSGDTLVRFLSDQSNLQDLIKIIWSLPSWPFIKQSLRREKTV